MSNAIETGWEVDQAIEPLNTKLARLTAEEKAEHYQEQAEHYATKSKVFLLFGADDITSGGFLDVGLVASTHNQELEDALNGLAAAEYQYVSGDIKIAKLVFTEEKTIEQVRKLVDEACENIDTVNITRIEAINSLQSPTI